MNKINACKTILVAGLIALSASAVAATAVKGHFTNQPSVKLPAGATTLSLKSFALATSNNDPAFHITVGNFSKHEINVAVVMSDGNGENVTVDPGSMKGIDYNIYNSYARTVTVANTQTFYNVYSHNCIQYNQDGSSEVAPNCG